MSMTHYADYLREGPRVRLPRRQGAQPTKAKEHRYERRKVRQFMRHGEWAESTPT
jgi:hypothetical protein